MERKGVARLPKPIWGRIPNFAGAAEAAERLRTLPVFADAHVVKVNPDAPQRPVREHVLEEGKILLVPTPRLRSGFLSINLAENPGMDVGYGATIKGAFRHGKPTRLRNLPKVDLIVAGSVAVSRNGVRVGKGGGYSEIEYGILREFGLVDDGTTIVTTIHDLQVVDDVPACEHDLIVDKIVTPTLVIDIGRKAARPKGILWDKVDRKMLRQMPILEELAKTKKTHADAWVRRQFLPDPSSTQMNSL